MATNDLDHLEGSYGVYLPCKASEFSEFIAGLLGKPQTLERSVRGAFIVRRDDIVNLCNLVDQRVHQQNEASLVQCTVRVVYHDSSSVLHNSLPAFVTYSEVAPVISVCVNVSWVYLVRFRNRSVPERQVIDVSIFTNDEERPGEIYVSLADVRGYERRMTTRIQHTERTWGVDLDSLLAGALSQLVIRPTRPARWIILHRGWIGFGVALFLIGGAAVTVLNSSNSLLASYLEKVKALDASSSSATVLASKMDFLVQVVSVGAWPRFVFAAVTFLMITVAVALALGEWVSNKARIPPRSFLLLSRAAEEDKQAWDQRIKRDWLLFGLSLLASIGTGVLSSWLFAQYFAGGVVTAL